MDSIAQLNWRYATKKFNPTKKIAESKIDILKKAFTLTATSYGLQPLKMVVVQNKEIQKKITQAAYNQQQVLDCSHLLVICIKTNINSEYVDQKFNLEKEIRGTSDEVLNGFKSFLKETLENMPHDEIQNTSKKQAYIALGNLMTVCAFEEIDSCPMEGFNPEKVDEILDLKNQNLHTTLLLPVGYRSEDDFMSKLPKVRIPVEESIIEIK